MQPDPDPGVVGTDPPPVRIEYDKYETIPIEMLQGRTRAEWLWLPDAAKAKLAETSTEPEWSE